MPKPDDLTRLIFDLAKVPAIVYQSKRPKTNKRRRTVNANIQTSR